MNVVATPSQVQKGIVTPNYKPTSNNKTTLAQIMSLNSQRNKQSRSNALKLSKREFAQTMIVPSTRKSSPSRTAKDKPSSKLLKKYQQT